MEILQLKVSSTSVFLYCKKYSDRSSFRFPGLALDFDHKFNLRVFLLLLAEFVPAVELVHKDYLIQMLDLAETSAFSFSSITIVRIVNPQ